MYAMSLHILISSCYSPTQAVCKHCKWTLCIGEDAPEGEMLLEAIKMNYKLHYLSLVMVLECTDKKCHSADLCQITKLFYGLFWKNNELACCYSLMTWPLKCMRTALWHMPREKKEVMTELAAFPLFPSTIILPGSHTACPNIIIIISIMCHTPRNTLETWPQFRRRAGTMAPVWNHYSQWTCPPLFFTQRWLLLASNTDSLLWNVKCIQPWLLSQMHVPLCVHVHKCVFVYQILTAPCIIRWSLPVCVERPAIIVYECVSTCTHFVTDVGSCMFALREEVRNITALLQTACSPAQLRSNRCLYDLTLGDKVTSSIIFSAGASVSYRLQ